MGVLPDWMIRDTGAIMPCEEGVKRVGRISYGLSSYGYDIRAGYKFKVFSNVWSSVIDPKNFDPKALVEVDATERGYVLVPPNSFALAESVETIHVPRSTLAIIIGKSTYARCGLVLNCTPLEPEWRGKITLELSNTTPLPMKVYANEGIGQVLFFESAGIVRAILDTMCLKLAGMTNALLSRKRMCDVSYEDKKGKYQDQIGLTNPKVD